MDMADAVMINVLHRREHLTVEDIWMSILVYVIRELRRALAYRP